MVCPTCVSESQASTVSAPTVLRASAEPVNQFWDENNAWHSHDPNARTASYQCSRGHTWERVERVPCPVPDCSFNVNLGATVPTPPG